MKILKANDIDFLVDDDIYDKIHQFKFGLAKCANKLYIRFSKERKSLHLHKYIMPCAKGLCVDHINGNTFDNRRENLRICTKQQNNFNKSIQSDNKTGYKGVTFDAQTKSKNKYRLEFWFQNKRILRKRFGTAIEAAIEYNELAKEYYGHFAKLNIIPTNDAWDKYHFELRG